MNENPTTADEQCDLGVCYASGEGVPLDMGKAVYWLTQVAEQGNENAKEALAKPGSKDTSWRNE
jgi:TPR repeat protein